MNKLTLTYLSAALLLLCGCSGKMPDPIVLTAPEVVFGQSFDRKTICVGDKITLSAKIVKGEQVDIKWTVEGRLEATTDTLSYVFDEPGEYEVSYLAENGSGKVEKKYVITVTDKLRISIAIPSDGIVKIFQYEKFAMVAVVENDLDVDHSWFIDDSLVSQEAYLKDFYIGEFRNYQVKYVGTCALGTYEKEFTIKVERIPLEVEFSEKGSEISANKNTDIVITATPLHEGVVASQVWYYDGKVLSTEKDFNYLPKIEGEHQIKYEALNPDDYKFTRSWSVFVNPPKRDGAVLVTGFEGSTTVPACLIKSGNTPGISVVDNPLREGINTSANCLVDQVTGNGTTSGYFTFSYSGAINMGIDPSKYKGIRFKCYFGPNKYRPVMEFKSTNYFPVEMPSYTGTWETVEYEFPAKINTYITIRPLKDKDGKDVGTITETNTKIIYIDDIELF